MKIENIIIITILPIGQRDFDRFGIGYFLEQNKKVVVLNIRDILYPNIPVSYDINKVKVQFDYFEINDYHFLENYLKEYNKVNTVIFSLFGYELKSYKVYASISKFDISYGALFVGAVPDVKSSINSNIYKRVKRIISIYKPTTLMKKVFERLYYKIVNKFTQIEKKIRPYDFVVVAGEVGNSMKNHSSTNTKIIQNHALDMDFVIKDEKIDLISDEYIVYLDEYLPHHSDFDLIGIDNQEIANQYYNKMNKFLDMLSDKYEKEVVICAHPRSEYDKHKVWKNKRIVLFQTYEYTKKALMCITHASTSTNFAVILDKPINFVYFQEISFYKKETYNAANSLGKDIIDIDLPKDELVKIDFLYRDEKKYKEYIHDYISLNIEDKRPFWEKVLIELQRI